MPNPLEKFLATLDLTPGVGGTSSRFTGPTEYTPRGRLFGGQVLAQAVAAASLEMDPDRAIHSMHGYFLRPGSLENDLAFDVQRIKEGRSFSTSQTSALQGTREIFTMLASFQVDATGLEHQPSMPAGVPNPETLPTVAEVTRGHAGPLPEWWANGRPFDVRYAGDPVYVEPSTKTTNRQRVWFRTRGALPDEPIVHRAALAYASDYATLDPIYRRHGLTHNNTALRSASLDHSMWWHRPARADEWILMDLESPASNAARGLTFGHMFAGDGTLVASFTQQLTVRLPRPPIR